MAIGLVLCAIVFILCLINYHWKRRHLYRAARKIPGPLTIPIIGNAYVFMCKDDDQFERAVALTKKYTPLMRLWLGPKLFIHTKNPDHIKKIASSSKMSIKDDIYKVFEPFVGNGLFTSSGQEWRVNRKFIGNLFTQDVLERSVKICQRHSQILADIFEKHVNQSTFDVYKYVAACILDVGFESLFGTKLNSLVGENMKFVHTLDHAFELINERFYKAWLHSDFVHQLTESGRQTQKCVANFRSFMQKMLKSKQVELDAQKAGLIPKATEKSLLEKILEKNEEVHNFANDDEIINEIATIIAASDDTTGTQMSVLLLAIGMYPDIQERVYQEIQTVLGDKDAFSYSDVLNLPYTMMVVKECLRMFTLSPFLPRKVNEDFDLGDFVLPHGSTVLIGVHAVHHDSDHWEKPNEFYPEHFLPEAVAKRHPYAYLPFSSGLRSCIGKYYAYALLITILVVILRRYRIEADGKMENLRLKTQISCRAIDGYKIRLFNR